MSANQHMALRVVWGTRLDDDTPAADARELLAMLGLIEPDGHEILPDRTSAGRLLNEKGQPVATAPPPSRRPSAALKEKTPSNRKGRAPKPIEHGSEYGYLQHKRKNESIPDDDSCGCQAAHDATLVRRPRRPDPHMSSSVLPPEHAEPTQQRPVLTVAPDVVPDVVSAPLRLGAPPHDLRADLLAACGSPRAGVRRSANRALAVLEQLHDALDDLTRAQARAASRTNGAT